MKSGLRRAILVRSVPSRVISEGPKLGSRRLPLGYRFAFCLRIMVALRAIGCHVIASATALGGPVRRGVDVGLRAGIAKHPGGGPSCPPAEDFPGPPLSAQPTGRNRD